MELLLEQIRERDAREWAPFQRMVYARRSSCANSKRFHVLIEGLDEGMIQTLKQTQQQAFPQSATGSDPLVVEPANTLTKSVIKLEEMSARSLRQLALEQKVYVVLSVLQALSIEN